jgi:hypothetical protein
MEDKPMRLQSPFTQEHQFKLEEAYKKEQLSALELARLNRARETKRKMDELYGTIKAERDRRDQRRRLISIEAVELVNIPAAESKNVSTSQIKEEKSINEESEINDKSSEEKTVDKQEADGLIFGLN